MNYITDMHFYSNVCHVCKVYGKKVQLKRCAGCKTIAYCSREHQRKHWSRHKDLCKLLTEIVQKAGTIFGYRDRSETSMKSWTRAKSNLMLLVKLKMGRDLNPDESEMFEFPRACKICHESDSQKLVDCPDCPATSFCLDHRLDNNHHKKCDTTKLCFDIETREEPFPPVNQKILSLIEITDNMREFVDLYLSHNDDDSVPSNLNGIWVSERLTRPLTFFNALKQLNAPKLAFINVHIIGANALEAESIACWETLLHHRESLMEMRLVLVGPELYRPNCNINLCESCNDKRKRIFVEYKVMLYTDYVQSKDFVQPDYIVGFNLGIHECVNESSPQDTWAPSLKELVNRNCPFVMTSYTLQESQEERKRLNDVLNKHLVPFYMGKNAFSSLRPYRDFESEDFFYQNDYITIYNRLR